MKIETATLRNGLRLASAYVKGTSFVDVTVAVRVGSRYEPVLQSGMSHFLEHMLFRGSKHYPSSYFLNHALETLGDGLEGGTTREFSLYSIQVPPENLEKVMVILGDVLMNPLLTDVETEKGIIFEEMLEDVDENGEESSVENLSRQLLFGEHSLAQRVLGTRATLEKVEHDDLLAHFREFYQPDNMVITATGDVDTRKFFRATREVFDATNDYFPEEKPYLDDAETEDAGQQFANIEPVDIGVDYLPSGKKGPVFLFRDKSASQVDVMLSFVGEGERSDDYVYQMAIERLLDDGLSSRLQRSLCERKGLLYDIAVILDSYTDVAVMDLSFRIVEEKARIALQEIFRELRRLRVEPVGAEELEKLKARLLREMHNFFECPRALGARMAEVMLLGLRTPLSLEEWKKRIAALDSENIQRVANKIFVPERMTVVIEGHVPPVDRGDIAQMLQRGLTQGF